MKRLISFILVFTIVVTSSISYQPVSLGKSSKENKQPPTDLKEGINTPMLDIYPYYNEETGNIMIIWDEKDNTNYKLYSRNDDESEFKLLAEISNRFEYQIEASNVGKYIDFRLVEIDIEGKETLSYISTIQKTSNGFERMVIDEDEDKIPNGYEIWDLKTDPNNDDTDKDGLPDGYEVFILGTDPLSLNNPDEDLDGDGITNINEYKNNTYPLSKDSDFDGLLDKDEIEKYSSNPNKVDSNRDGINDFEKYGNKKQKKYYGFESIDRFYDTIVMNTNDPSIAQYTYNYLTNTITQVKYANGLMINYLYDINNNPIAIISNEDNKISVTSYSYEDKKVDSISTNGNTYFIDYDSKGKVKKINIGKQKLVEYSYDGDMIKQIKHGNGGSSEYEFDPNNNMTAMSENGEVKSTWEYNEDGKVIKQVDNENSVTYDYSYDENGEVVGITTNDGFTIEVNNHEDGYTLDYTINGVSLTHEVSIDPESGDSTLVMSNGVSVGINRSDEEISSTIRHKNKDIISQSFKIKDNHITSVSCNNNNLSYKYDVMGNIESLEENGSKMEQYEYDMKGQLIRVDSKYTNTSVLYEYDNGGNILNKTEYEYSNDVLKNIIKQDIFSYSDGNWKDKLTAYNGEEFTYDQYGNILSYRDGFTFNWDNGRMLTNATNIKYNINYKYNSNGLRTEKDVNGTKTTYYYDGSKIIKEDNNEYEIWYLYDTTGNIIGFDYDNNKYFYEKNIQNDIIGIYNESGDKIVSYVYDGWGKIVTMDGEMASTIGKINPFRYRSYYYDNETGLYYLQSRYYDPEICRFINADTLFDFGCGLQGYNLFQYCGNNPINRIDPTGQWVISLGIEFKAACIYGLFMSLQVNMDQNLNGSLTYTVGPVVMINASISFAGFICFYPSFTSVNQVLGWAFSAGVSWSMGLYGGASYGFNIASNNIYSNYCVSLGVGTSLAAIPTLYVQAGYTKLIKNFNVASLLSNLGTGQYNSYTNQGTKLYIKKSGSHYIDIYTNKFSKKVRIYDSKDIKVRD